MKKIKIFIGADHAGFNIKEKLIPYLIKLKYSITDLGDLKYNKTDDYPIYAKKVAKAVVKTKNSKGILICGSGQGVCIAANKVHGIRAALAEKVKDAYMARRDDDCNVICLQGRYTKFNLAKRIVHKFLETDFKAIKRYKRRVNEINRIEQ